MKRTDSPQMRRLGTAISADGFNQLAHFRLGREYHNAERFMEAAAQFRRCTELNPENTDAWLWMGGCYEKLDIPKEAISAYRAGVEAARYNEDLAAERILQQEYDRLQGVSV